MSTSGVLEAKAWVPSFHTAIVRGMFQYCATAPSQSSFFPLTSAGTAGLLSFGHGPKKSYRPASPELLFWLLSLWLWFWHGLWWSALKDSLGWPTGLWRRWISEFQLGPEELGRTRKMTFLPCNPDWGWANLPFCIKQPTVLGKIIRKSRKCS